METPEFRWVTANELEPFINMRVRPEDPFEWKQFKESIRKGINQNLKARPHLKKKGKFEVYIGRRRLRAAKEWLKVGVEIPIPLLIQEVTDEDAMMMTLEENVERRSVSAYEIGNWIRMLQMKLGLTQTEMGRRIGKSQSWVNRHLRIVEEIEKRQNSDDFDYSTFDKVTQTAAQAAQFIKAPEEMQAGILDSILRGEKAPSGKEIARRRKRNELATAVLNRFNPHLMDDDQYLIELLNQEIGMGVEDAQGAINSWRYGPKKPGLKTLRINTKESEMWKQLTKYYPLPIVEKVETCVKAKTLETMIRYCRRYMATLFNKATFELQQAALEEFMQ